MSFKPIFEFHNPTIDKLIVQIEQQKNLLVVVKSVLPENLAEHALHCLIHDDTLLLYTDAAVWSSQLRFYQEAILTALSPLSEQPLKRLQTRLLTQK